MLDDGYNARWLGDDVLSPMEKYDKAFNGWEPSMGFDDFLALTRFERPGEPYDQEYYDEMGKATAWAHEGGNARARALTSPDGTPLWDENSTEDAWPGTGHRSRHPVVTPPLASMLHHCCAQIRRARVH